MHQGEKRKLVEIQDNPEYDDGIREDIRNRIERLNDDLKVRQESIMQSPEGKTQQPDYIDQRDDCKSVGQRHLISQKDPDTV